MSTTHFPRRGDKITVNGRQNPCAIHHTRERGEHGVVTSVDDVSAMNGLPSIEVIFDTPHTPDGSRFELFYPTEVTANKEE
jgi:hypothetical protein